MLSAGCRSSAAVIQPPRTPMRLLAGLFLLFACATPAPTPVQRVVEPLPADDPRQALVGTWDIVFIADTVSFRQPPTDNVVKGQVIIRDSLVSWMSPKPTLMRGYLTADFTPVLGRPISCYAPENGVIEATIQGDSVGLQFAPYAGDCGLDVLGTLSGDSVTGRWLEPSYSGGQSWGHFTMIHRATH